MDRRLRAARDAAIIAALTAGAVAYQSNRESDEDLLPADVTLTEPVVPGTHQLQFLVRGGGCDQPKERRGRGYKSPHDRIERTHTQFDDDARTIVITFRVEPPGPYACTGEDPGVPWTVSLPVPVGDRKVLDGTKTPPQPFPTGPPRTLPLDAIPGPGPSRAPTAQPTPNRR